MDNLFGTDLFGKQIKLKTRSPLADEFIEPPLSVLNGRNQSRRWMQRKSAWMSYLPKQQDDYLGNYKLGSEFDPVLCEIMYSWFCPPAGRILDPFAGGMVRGMVASKLGYKYYGIDIRDIDRINYNNTTYIVGDSLTELKDAPDSDMIFTCPPYGNLEVYSDDTKDLSTMCYSEFIDNYNVIICSCVDKLVGEYACFVVANYRENEYYRNLVGDTITAFEGAGMRLYNDMIYLTPLGSSFMRCKKAFTNSKKVIKVHQNILVFKK